MAAGARNLRSRVGRAPPHHQHCRAHRDKGGQRPGVGQRGDLGQRESAPAMTRRHDRGEDGDPDRRAALRHARQARRQAGRRAPW